MAGYRILNNGNFATNAGVVNSGSLIAPDIDGGAIKSNVATSNLSAGLRGANLSAGNNTNPQLSMYKDFGPADVGVFLSTSGITSGLNNLAKIGRTAHGLATGTFVVLTDTSGLIAGPARVVGLDSTTGFVINRKYSNQIGTVTYAPVVGTFGTMQYRNYAAKKLSSNVHGQVSNKLQTGAADYGRDAVHKVNAVRTRKDATAVRAGLYNVFTGRFTTDPTAANDYAGFDVDGTDIPDDETKRLTSSGYTLGGRFTFKQQRSMVTGIYDKKTT